MASPYAERGVVKLATNGTRAPFAHLAKKPDDDSPALKTLCGKPTRTTWTPDAGSTIPCEKCVAVFDGAPKPAKKAKAKASPSTAQAPERSYAEDLKAKGLDEPADVRVSLPLESGERAALTREESGRVTMSVGGGKEVEIGKTVGEAVRNLERAARTYEAPGRRVQKRLDGGMIDLDAVEVEVVSKSGVKLKAGLFSLSISDDDAEELRGEDPVTRMNAVASKMRARKDGGRIPRGEDWDRSLERLEQKIVDGW